MKKVILILVGLLIAVPAIAEMDFGDVRGYPTLLPNGARHTIVNGVRLGPSIDPEPDGQPNFTATGDDNDGNDDEDGVVFSGPLVPGQIGRVDVTASIDGALDAWVDFNIDGSWAEAGDQIFAAEPLAAGMNTLLFNVPNSASMNVVTYARFRFSTDGGHSYAGAARNGEVEDYTVKIVQKPTGDHLKWSQPPIEFDPMMEMPLFCGWDEMSVIRPYSTIEQQIVGDDFRCLGPMPVRSVRWWGSYLNWEGISPPPVAPDAWVIGFWSNVPADGFVGYSYPRKLLWQVTVDASRVHTQWAGRDQFIDPGLFPDTCFRYDVKLEKKEYFWQERYLSSATHDTVFWITIAALYSDNGNPQYPWGFKTRPWH